MKDCFNMTLTFVSSDPAGIRMFVMDEADEMLSKGFLDQIYDLFQFLPHDIQVLQSYLYSSKSTSDTLHHYIHA